MIVGPPMPMPMMLKDRGTCQRASSSLTTRAWAGSSPAPPYSRGLVVVALAGSCGGTSEASKRERQVRELAKQAGLPADAADVFGRAAGAVGKTFEVTYGAGASRIVVSHKGRDLRVDVGADQSVIVHDDVTYQCERTQGTWQCQRSGQPYTGLGALDDASLRRTLASLRRS